MELYFIRHAQSINNANWNKDGFQDHPDPELTVTGQLQVRCLTEYLSNNQPRDETKSWNSYNQYGFGLTHLYSSLMVRALETAAPISEAIQLPLVAWPEIHETGGIFSRVDGEKRTGLPGKTRSELLARFPNLILPDWVGEDGWWQSRPFEEDHGSARRANAVWLELLRRHADQPGRPEHRVAFVSHGGFFMRLLTSALQIEMPPRNKERHEFWFLMNNCAITRLDVKDQVLIAYTNRADFLPAHLIT